MCIRDRRERGWCCCWHVLGRGLTRPMTVQRLPGSQCGCGPAVGPPTTTAQLQEHRHRLAQARAAGSVGRRRRRRALGKVKPVGRWDLAGLWLDWVDFGWDFRDPQEAQMSWWSARRHEARLDWPPEVSDDRGPGSLAEGGPAEASWEPGASPQQALAPRR